MLSCRSAVATGILSFLLAVAAAHASEYYVDMAGDDANPGTAEAPWRTIQHAVDSIQPGDTITVRPGTYVGARISSSGRPDAPKTLRSQTKWGAILNEPSAAARQNGILELENRGTPAVGYWIVEDFEVDGGLSHRGIDIRGRTDAPARHITIRGNHVHHAANNGRRSTGIFDGFHEYALYENNVSHNNTEHGIYHSNTPGDHAVIRGNIVFSNAGCGIHNNADLSLGGTGIIRYSVWERNLAYDNNSGSGLNYDGISDSIIRNNILFDNRGSGISLYAIDGAEGSSRNLVYNNTIIMPENGRWAVNIAHHERRSAPVGNKLKNNIIYNHHPARGVILTYSSSVSGFESDYNVVQAGDRFSVDGGSTRISLSEWQQHGWDLNSIISTPEELFVDAESHDYRLHPGSPAIDAGTTLEEVTEDFDGTPRPQGEAYDIGAYEYSPSGGVPTPVIAPEGD